MKTRIVNYVISALSVLEARFFLQQAVQLKLILKYSFQQWMLKSECNRCEE